MEYEILILSSDSRYFWSVAHNILPFAKDPCVSVGFHVIAAKTTREYHSSYLRLHTSTHECMWVTCEYTRLNMVTCRLTLYTITLVTCESIGAIKMKCTIFLALCFISTCARDMLCIHNQANASATRVRTTHMRHTSVPHKARVQSKLQHRGETQSVHEDVEPIGIGE